MILKLVGVHALEGGYAPEGLGLTPDWDRMVAQLDEGSETLGDLFLRD